MRDKHRNAIAAGGYHCIPRKMPDVYPDFLFQRINQEIHALFLVRLFEQDAWARIGF
jgi:hypothetical protein